MAFAVPAITAGVGLLGSFLGSRGKQNRGKFKQVPTLNPQQQSVLSQLLGGVSNTLPQGFAHLQNILSDDPQEMQNFEAPYMRQFKEQIIPQLSEQFAGLGAQSSSAFQNALGQAGADLSERLAYLRSGLKQGALSQLGSLTQSGFTSPHENIYMQKGPSGMQNFGNALAPLAGQGIGSIMQSLQQKNLISALSRLGK